MRIIKIKLRYGFPKIKKMDKGANIKFSLLFFRKKNNRGDLPVTLLIIGVFAVCTLALLSFFYSSFLIHKSFVGVGVVEKVNIQIEEDSLNHIYIEEKINVFSPGLDGGLHLFEEKIIFSIEYNS